MSMESYARNEALGVTDSPTCLVASLEKITPNYGYEPSVYTDHAAFCDWYDTLTPEQEGEFDYKFGDALDKLVRPLGGLSCSDVYFYTANDIKTWVKVVDILLESRQFRVVVDIFDRDNFRHGPNEKICHAVGILSDRRSDRVKLASNYVPAELHGYVPLWRIAERLWRHNTIGIGTKYPRYPWTDTNIMAVPIV